MDTNDHGWRLVKLTVIIPTINGRGDSLKRTLDAYKQSFMHTGFQWQILVMRDRPNWPTACNDGMIEATGDIIHFGADDLVPVGDWLTPCLPVLDRGELPAAYCWNHEYTGDWHDADNVGDGAPGDLTTFTRVPVLTRAMAEAIGPWPNIDYYGDNWVSDKARTFGWPTRLVDGYHFVHHWNQVGRLDSAENVERSRVEYERLRSEL